MNTHEQFVERLREVNLSTQRMAEYLGVEESTIRRWRHGRSLPPPHMWTGILNSFSIYGRPVLKNEGLNGRMPTHF